MEFLPGSQKGYNDNNFNRKDFPSNRIQFSECQTASPFGNYHNRSVIGNQPFGQYPDSHVPNQPLIPRINHVNTHDNILHDNLGDNLLDEHIF